MVSKHDLGFLVFLLGKGQVFCSASMANSTKTILDNLTSKMMEVLSRVQTSSALITNSPMVPLSIKLDGYNYGLWSQERQTGIHQ